MDKSILSRLFAMVLIISQPLLAEDLGTEGSAGGVNLRNAPGSMTGNFLSDGAPAGAKVKDRPDCSQGKEALAAKNNQFYLEAKAKMKNSAALDKCFQSTQRHLDQCAGEVKNLGECNGLAPSGTAQSGGGIPAASDGMTKEFVKASNCYRGMSSCYHRGPIANQGLAKQNYQLCVEQTANETPEDKAAIKSYYDSYYNNVKQDQFSCWRKGGDAYEQQARDNLAKSQSSKTKDGFAGQAIDCIDHNNGNRVCQFQGSGGNHFGQVPTKGGVEQVGNGSPARLGGPGCSGTLLGDGVTVVTSGHCTSGRSAQQAVEVFNNQGQREKITADCSQGINQGYNSSTNSSGTDFSVCKLSLPVNANPVYLATYDSTNTGSGCTTTGYVMSCGRGFFQNLTQQPVSMQAYPRQVNGNDWSEPKQPAMTWSRGTLFWNDNNNNLTTDMVCTGGCSGAGYIVDYNGQQLVVGAHGYDNRYSPGGGGAAVIPTQQFNGMRVQSISTPKLAEGTIIFAQMPL